MSAFRAWDSGFRDQASSAWGLPSGCTWCGVLKVTSLRLQGLRFTVQGSRFKVAAAEFRVTRVPRS